MILKVSQSFQSFSIDTISCFFSVSYKAVLVVGAGTQVGAIRNSAELFLPSSGTSCTLPSLSIGRTWHTVNNHVLCGGLWSAADSCLKWSPDTGTWEEMLTLDVGRYRHVSWTPNNGIGTYLMGGSNSPNTTTLIKAVGTQEQSFQLLVHLLATGTMDLVCRTSML